MKLKSIPKNYNSEIEKLSSKQTTYIQKIGGGKQIIKIPVFKKEEKVGEHFYLFDKKNYIGKGSSGTVYKVFPIDENGDLQIASPHALKIISAKNFDRKEISIFKRHYKCELPLQIAHDIYLIMECFPGVDLCNEYEELNNEFKNLNFSEVLELIYQISLSVNIYHHSTTTGRAVIHADLKGQNIKVNRNKETGSLDVYPFDFGVSHLIEEDDPNKIYGSKVRGGTREFMAPEVALFNYGIKSDIYALTSIILQLLGATNPYKYKDQASRENFYVTRYNRKGLLVKFKNVINAIPFPLEGVINQFIDRMEKNNYQDRADSDEFLKFFATLNNFLKMHLATLDTTAWSKRKNYFARNSKDVMKDYFAIMILIASGLSHVLEKNDHYLNQPELNNEIISCYKANSLSFDMGFFQKIIDEFEAIRLKARMWIDLNTESFPEIIISKLKEYEQDNPSMVFETINRLQTFMENPLKLDFIAKLVELINKYGAELPPSEFLKILKNDDIDPSPALKALLDKQQSLKAASGKLSSFFSEGNTSQGLLIDLNKIDKNSGLGIGSLEEEYIKIVCNEMQKLEENELLNEFIYM